IYGVMAYLVSQGTREMGIRMALGATPGAILSLVLRQGVLIAIVGIVVGIGGAVVLTRLMRGLLFGIEPADPLTIGVTSALIGLTALAACYFPARRAAKIDPLVVMK